MKRCMGCMALMKEEERVCKSCGYEEGTPPKEAYHMEPGSILSGRYIAGRVLGFGGFGVTYVGWDEQLQRKVAIKEFLPSSMATRMPGDTELSVYGGEAGQQFQAGLERFVEEARRLARFNGIPGIVDIYDTFVENNTAYIVMEFLKGQDVKRRLEQDGVFPYEEARKIVLDVCETLKPVHGEGIIHRDIAPDNIYLTEGGEVKLLDFGASRFVTGVNSKSLSVILKAGYAPEEQYRSRGNQGSWSDVYALAATFYRMITGVTPPDSMERAIRDELGEPSKLGAVLPPEGEHAILNALNVRRENRTQTVEEFALQLCSDKVERVKEKTVKDDSGKLPLWGRIVLGSGVGMALLFGLLIATGEIKTGQGGLLQDRFGSGVENGYLNAPGVVNQMESEAQSIVRDAGLEYLIVGTEYSDNIAKGKILSQSPLPGRAIALGEKLQVTVSGGSRKEAIAAGEMTMPDVTFMDAGMAMYTMEEADFSYSIQYEFSDTVAENLIVRYEPYESGNGARLIVSVGKKGQIGDYGQVRAPLYNGQQRRLQFLVTVEGKLENGVTHGLQYRDSQDGTWHDLLGADGRPWQDNDSYYVGENRPMIVCYIYIPQIIILANQKLLGQELSFKLIRYTRNDAREAYVKIDETEIPGTITVTGDADGITATGMELSDWETIARMEAEKKWAPNHPLVDILETDQEKMEDYVPAQLMGNFKKGRYYQILTSDWNLGSYSGGERCDQDGTLYIRVDKDWTEEKTEQTCTWYIVERGKGSIVEPIKVAVEMGASGTVTLEDGQVTENGKGRPLLEAAKRYLNREEKISLSYVSSREKPGTVVGESIGSRLSFTVSVGMASDQTEEGSFLLGYMFPFAREELLHGVLYSEDESGRYDGAYDVIYSQDGGNSFQILSGREGREPLNHAKSAIRESNLSIREMAFHYVTDILFVDRPDLWGKELILGMQRDTKTVMEETLLILEDREPAAVESVTLLDDETLRKYREEGRLPDSGYAGTQYRLHEQGTLIGAIFYQADGDFQEGCTYYIMPGGDGDATRPYPCVRDGELIFEVPDIRKDSSWISEENRNTTIQSLDYEYHPDRKQLTAHISRPVTVDMERLFIEADVKQKEGT